MDKLAQNLELTHRIDLAREADFTLGPLRIRPSRCEVDADGVRRVLQRKVMQVLVALAHSTSDVVSQRELIVRCWGGLSVSDDAIGRCIGQLRRLAEDWPQPPFEIETITGVGYRLDPAGVRPGMAAPPSPAPQFIRSRMVWLAVVAVVIAAGLVAVYSARPQGADRNIKTPSIAVSEFQAPGGDGKARALAASLASPVTDALSRYDVTVFTPPSGDSATASHADFVVGGRVVERDHRLFVTTDLLDPSQHVLVYSFDTAVPADKGDLASEIANHVALSLDPTKLSNDLNGKLTALDFTLIARINDGIDRWEMPYVLDESQKLTHRHPDDGDLRASVAMTAIYAAQEAPASQQMQLLQLGRRSLAQAEQLSPKSGMSSMARELLTNGPSAYAEQERLLRKSLSLTPGFHVTYNALGEMLMMVGRLNEAVPLIERSTQLDPMSGVVVNAAVGDLVKAGRADEAQRMLDRAEQIWPDDWKTIGSEFYVAFYQGTPQQTFDFARLHVPPKGSTAARIIDDLGLDAWRTRDPRSIDRMVAKCFADMREPPRQVIADPTPQLVAPDCLIQMVRLGAMDDAFRFAALAYPDHRNLFPVDADQWITQPWQWRDPSWLFTPSMEPFRNDPRFWSVAVRTGLADYWRSTGSWPDFCQPQLDHCKALAAAASRAQPAKPAGRRS